MTRQVVTGTAPSHWAAYLVNGDGCELEPDEADKAEAFADWLCGRPWRAGMIVSCDDAGFMWSHDAMRVCGALASDCQTYTALVEGGAS